VIIKRRNKERIAEAIKRDKKEAMGDLSHLKNKKGELIHQPLPQPTLPNISIDDDLADIASLQKRPAPSTYTSGSDKYYAADATASYDYPAMPAYNHYAQDANSYARHNPSGTTLHDDNHLYGDDYGSTSHLALAADPQPQYDDYYRQGAGQQHSEHQGYLSDPYDLYIGHAVGGQYDYNNTQHTHQPGPQTSAGQHAHDPADDVSLAYDDAPGYPGYQTAPQQGYHHHGGGQFHAV
jgi:hypothetical protein